MSAAAHVVDAVVVGAGIAGASAGWALAEHGRVAVVEQAPAAGVHASGRSASVLSETSGHRVVCALAAASRAFFEAPPEGFADHAAYDEATLNRLATRAAEPGAGLVTTEKDWARLPADWRARVAAWPVRARFKDEAALDALLSRQL